MVRNVSAELLLGELYAGITDAERMARFTQMAAHSLGSHTGAWTVREDSLSKAHLLRVEGEMHPDAGRVRAYGDGGASSDNLWYLRSRPRMKVGTAIDGDDFASPAEVKSTRYYADLLRGIDTLHSIGVCASIDAQRVVVLTFCRNGSAGSYEPSDRNLASFLAPHIAHAYRLGEELSPAKYLSRRRVDIALDDQLVPCSWDDALVAFGQAAHLSVRRGTALAPHNMVSRAAWKLHCDMHRRNLCAPPFPIALLDRANETVGVMQLLQVGVFNPASNVKFCCRITLLKSPHSGDVTRALIGIFELTPAEARLALALHACGELNTAAQAVGTSKETARTRLKMIFVKTGLRRQAGLVALVDAVVDQYR